MDGVGNRSVNADALSILDASSGLINTQTIVTNVIVTFLFGVVSILAAASAYFLTKRGVKQRSTKILLCATALLYTSTAFHWAVNVAYMLSFNHLAASAAANIHAPVFSTSAIMTLRTVQQHATPTALTINMFVGDIIVWWRALVLWPGQKLVRCLCGICLLVATLGLTFMSIVSSSVDLSLEEQPNSVDMVSAFFSGVFGALSALLSLITNAAATTMIGFKTWQHRRFLRQHLGRNRSRTQVLKVLILLVESGAVYCGMWVLVAAYAFSATFGKTSAQAAPAWHAFTYYLTNGCLISLVAIYPMVIIVLVSLNKSQIAGSVQDLTPSGTQSSHQRHGVLTTTIPLRSVSEGRSQSSK